MPNDEEKELAIQKFNIWVFMVYFLPSAAKRVDVVQLVSYVQILGFFFKSGAVVNKVAINHLCVCDHMQFMVL